MRNDLSRPTPRCRFTLDLFEAGGGRRMKLLAKINLTWWDGDLPRFGDYLKSERGRTAFRVVGIRRPQKIHAAYVAQLSCERVKASALPADATVHPFRWNRRERRR